MKFTMLIKLVAEQNQRENWRRKAERQKSHRQAVTAAVIDAGYRVIRELKVGPKKSWYVTRLVSPPALPLRIVITRIAPRALDDDGAVAGAKAVRDQLAELLNVNDADRRIRWVVEQRRGAVGQHGVEVVVEALEVVAQPAPTEVP